MKGLNPFVVISNNFVTEFREFNENIRRNLKCPELLVYFNRETRKSENYFAISNILNDQGVCSFGEKVQMCVFRFISFPIWISLSQDESVHRTYGMFWKTSTSLRKKKFNLQTT